MKILEQVWTQPCQLAMEMRIVAGMVLCSSKHGIKCFDRHTGHLLWSDPADLGDGVAAVDSATLLACRRDPWEDTTNVRPPALVELDAQTGRELRSFDCSMGPVAVQGNMVLSRRFADDSAGSELAVLDRDSGRQIWSVSAPGFEHCVWQCLFARDSVIAVRGGAVECRSASDGSLRWRRSLEEHGGAHALVEPVLADPVLVLTVVGGTIALDVGDGATRWFRPFEARCLIVGHRAFLTQEPLLLACDALTGVVLTEVRVRDEMPRLKGGRTNAAAGAALNCRGWLVLIDRAHRLWVFDPETCRAVGLIEPKRSLPPAQGSIVADDCIYTHTVGLTEDLPPSIYCHRLLLPPRQA